MPQPQTKPAARASRKPISQSEVQAVIDMEHKVDARILSLRRRLQSGATVEPGKWQLTDDGSTIEPSENIADGGFRCGLEILEETAALGASLTSR